jgi:hypothetical protein
MGDFCRKGGAYPISLFCFDFVIDLSATVSRKYDRPDISENVLLLYILS